MWLVSWLRGHVGKREPLAWQASCKHFPLPALPLLLWMPLRKFWAWDKKGRLADAAVESAPPLTQHSTAPGPRNLDGCCLSLWRRRPSCCDLGSFPYRGSAFPASVLLRAALRGGLLKPSDTSKESHLCPCCQLELSSSGPSHRTRRSAALRPNMKGRFPRKANEGKGARKERKNASTWPQSESNQLIILWSHRCFWS